MRKLVDAPRKKKQWTEKEEAFLQDKWGTVSIKGLSKALGRSENAIIVRAQRLGCGAHLESDVRISLNQFMLALYGGAQMGGYTSNRLIQNGLPVKWHRVKKNRFRVIDIEDFWKWAEKNKSLLDFSRFDKYTLGAEPDWVDEKRKADFKKLQLHGQHNAAWTKAEVSCFLLLLIQLCVYASAAALAVSSMAFCASIPAMNEFVIIMTRVLFSSGTFARVAAIFSASLSCSAVYLLAFAMVFPPSVWCSIFVLLGLLYVLSAQSSSIFCWLCDFLLTNALFCCIIIHERW